MIYESQKLILLRLIGALLWFLSTVNTGRQGAPAPPRPPFNEAKFFLLCKIGVGKREGVVKKVLTIPLLC